jgi:hypothetical protein
MTTDPDTDAPAANAQDLADEVVGHLLRHPDPVQRYEALRLVDERLQWMRVLTLKQLESELGGLGPAAAAVGISRQAVTELYAKTRTPGPRGDRDRDSRPAYQYGRWLAWCERAAEAVNAEREWWPVQDNATRTTTVYPGLRRRVDNWARRAQRTRSQLPAEPDVDDALAQLGARHLTTAEQMDVYIGYHHGRRESR